MRFKFVLIILVLFLNINAFGQTRIITGTVITEDLEPVPQVFIQNSDTLLLANGDLYGKFKIEVPIDTKRLIFCMVGMEWKTIHLPINCDHLEIILMYDGTYDFMSARKIDRIRKKRFEKLPEIHQMAFKKGIFTTEKPCYENEFIPIRVEMEKLKNNRRKNKKPGT